MCVVRREAELGGYSWRYAEDEIDNGDDDDDDDDDDDEADE
jgi:hypothetical protein